MFTRPGHRYKTHVAPRQLRSWDTCLDISSADRHVSTFVFLSMLIEGCFWWVIYVCIHMLLYRLLLHIYMLLYRLLLHIYMLLYRLLLHIYILLYRLLLHIYMLLYRLLLHIYMLLYRLLLHIYMLLYRSLWHIYMLLYIYIMLLCGIIYPCLHSQIASCWWYIPYTCDIRMISSYMEVS